MENKKYYWIKLKTDFFNLDEIDFLLSQENGCKYIVLYQMLCLKTANNGGFLDTKIGEMIVPFDAEKIARDTKYFDIDTVIVAMELFKKLGLIYEEQDRSLKIAAIESMVGSESASKAAVKKREYRLRKKMEQKLLGDNMGTNCPTEIENRDKSIDIDKDIDIKKKDIKQKYGEYKHVLLTDKEYTSLESDYGSSNTQVIIKYLDEYLEMKGTKYKSHYMVIKKWGAKAALENRNKETLGLFKRLIEA